MPSREASRFYVKKSLLTVNNIPVWCNIRGDNLTALDRHKCKYVLAAILAGKDIEVGGFGRYRVSGHCIPAQAVQCEGLWLIYTRTDVPAVNMPAMVRKTLSAMYSCVDGYDFHDVDGTKFLRRHFDVDRDLIAHTREASPPTAGEFVRANITAEHHTHYRPEEIWKIAKNHKVSFRAMSIVLSRLRKISGITEATVATFLAYMLVCRPQVAYLVATSRRIWEVKDVTQLVESLKNLATPLKSMHNPEILDLTELFELQCLVNRGVGSINWVAEKRNRQKPDVINVSNDDVYKNAVLIFQQGVRFGYKYKTLDVDKYIQTRWEWVPTGSVHSQYAEDQKYIAKDYRHKTKFVTVNSMDSKKLRTVMQRPPEIHAWASVKYEWAKQRAIYGVDLTSALITNFAMYRCEEVFKHHFPVGEEAAATRVHARLKYMLRDNESFCYDFDDFNSQHSTSAMQMVLIAYYNVFAEQMSPDQKDAMIWIIKSLDNVRVHNNMGDDPEVYKTNGTLLSGWRLTTFINTALNYIYFKIAGCLDLDGAVDSVHNGDDVLVSIKNLETAVQIHHRMAAINARAQPTKCNVFSVGEFLRVEHKVSKEEGLGAQYLARSCATLVHSRVESQEPTKFTDAVKAAYTRAVEVGQRAKVEVSLLKDLVDDAISRICKIFGRPTSEGVLITESHAVVGGVLTNDFAPIEYLIEEDVEYEQEERGVEAERITVGNLMPGILDYARALSQTYEGLMDEKSILKKVIGATRRQISVTRKTWLKISLLPPVTRYMYGRALYKMYHGIIDIPHIEKARFVGIPPIALIDSRSKNIVKSIITSVADVDYALRVLI
jgi:hypothetical protein